MIADILVEIFVFAFGLCIGSFLNCVIYRLEEGKSLKGRSFCPNCKHVLNWLDLFPVFSYLFLGGKCRYCSRRISVQYPLVELATAVVFVLIWSFGFDWALDIGFWDLIKPFFLFYIASSLIIIFIYDLKHYLIPDKILFPAIIVTAVFRILDFKDLLGFIFAALIASGFFLAIFLVSRGKWMGFGDVKLAILMGLLLGFEGVLAALFLAFFFGAIIGVILMIFGKKGFKSEIPFGPFLIIGTFMALFWGQEIIDFYLKLF